MNLANPMNHVLGAISGVVLAFTFGPWFFLLTAISLLLLANHFARVIFS